MPHSELIKVGGVIHKILPQQLVLEGQGLKATLQLADTSAYFVGGLVAVTVNMKDCRWSKEEKTIYISNLEEISVLKTPSEKPAIHSRQSVSLLWSRFLQQIRSYLSDQQLLEVRTPGLVINSGMEPYLHPFETSWKMGGKQYTLRLPTSPELHLKKLLCHGYTDIFEIKNCYRNQELTDIHEPEFLMLEWYRAFADLKLIEQDLCGLLRIFKPELEVEVTGFPQLFKKQFNFDLKPQTKYEELKALAKAQKLDVQSADNFDEVFQLIVSFLIEPQLNKDVATIIYDFPPSQAALAKIEDNGFAGRFELYWQGLELANAFHELQDADIQRQRHIEDLRKRKDLGYNLMPLDDQFIKSLRRGLPPSGGIALGLDRLFMAVYGIKTIQETRVFNIEDQTTV